MMHNHNDISTELAASFETLEQRCYLSASMAGDEWVIRDDVGIGARGSSIIVTVDPDDPSLLRASIRRRSNDHVIREYTQAIEDVGSIRVHAGKGDDYVLIDLGADLAIPATLRGGAGDDRLIGGAGDDVLIGGAGWDLLEGGLGDDVLRGGGGWDTLQGGPGNDMLVGGAGLDILQGGLGDDVLRGGRGRDELDGGAGDDQLSGGGGADILQGDSGDDVLAGGRGSDELDGGAGDDQLSGGSGRDTLWGGDGVDLLRGGRGNDELWGGPDPDRLIADRGRDTIHGSELFDVVSMGRNDVLTHDETDAPAFTSVAADTDGIGAVIEATVSRWAHWFAMGPQDELPADCYQAIYIEYDLPSRITTDSAFSSSHSQTNTQEAGVDEGDIAETDGEYLYLIAGGNLVILDALPADDLHTISETDIEGTPVAMYLDGDRVTVISRSGWNWRQVQPHTSTGSYTWVKTTVFDVSDPSSPVIAEETVMDGSYVNSRYIDGRVYLVLSDSVKVTSPTWTWHEILGKFIVESEASYRQRLAEYLQDRLSAAAVGVALTSQMIVDPRFVQPRVHFVTVAALNVLDDQSGATATTLLPGRVGKIYASTDSLYITQLESVREDSVSRSFTRISKLDLTDPEIPLVATGIVPGQLLEQFAVDEHDGFFRIATTERLADWSWTNHLFVMAPNGAALEVVGSVTDLAPTEKVYSARFTDDTAYIVTYRKVDPLFTIDLTDPTDPHVVGELKIPGYSDYLHILDENHVIGFGRGAINGLYQEMQLSLFDVSDPSNPQRVDLYSFSGGRGGHSAALYEHHAFSYFAEEGILALPTTEGYGGEGGVDVFSVTADDGIEYLGRVSGDGARRAMRIGENLYSVFDGVVKVTPLDEPETVLSSADVPDTPDEIYYIVNPWIPITIALPDIMPVSPGFLISVPRAS